MIFKIFQAGSFAALILIFSLIISAAYLLVYLRCPRSSRPYIAGFALILGAAASAPLWGVRPQMITLLFFSLFLYLLERYRQEHQLRYLIPLPVLMLAWVNLHGGYILGLGVMGVYIAGAVIELIWQATREKAAIRETIQPVLTQIGIFIGSLLAALINPNGIRILTYPFETLTDPAMHAFIQEWFPPDFRELMWLPLALLIAALVISSIRGHHTRSISQILLVLIFGYLALRSMRNVPLFVVVAVPVLAGQIDSFLGAKLAQLKANKQFNWINLVVSGLLIIVVALRFQQQAGDQAQAEAKDFPKQAADWILDHRPTGNMFNAYNWGGYLIYRLYPDFPVCIDGRADLYGPAFFSQYAGTYLAKPGWEETFTRENIAYVLVEPTSPLAGSLRQSAGWDIPFEDEISVIFQRR
ncbi:hypothetical protein FDZ74_10455 [bacterium]|nr:MAG: hypothetical protein FDZ74_10455 [bacterium]